MSETKCLNNCRKLAMNLKNCDGLECEAIDRKFWYFADYLVENYPWSYTEIEVMLDMA